MIALAVRFQQGAFKIEADIRAQGRVLALCGPSGAGKTTLLNLIAGLARPAEGRIAMGEAVFFDSARGVDVAPRLRRFGYVFQEPRLFPHMTVAQNLKYGARFADRRDALIEFDDVVAMIGVESLLGRRPALLSGGEKQRVAIGRALLANPKALLMDEPLAAIDDARRREILGLVESLRDAFAIPIVFVSHRLSEVERLASDVALIEGGRLVEMLSGGAKFGAAADPPRDGALMLSPATRRDGLRDPSFPGRR